MKYLISMILLLTFIACGDAQTAQTIAETTAQELQPILSNEDVQPPKPPSL